MNKKDFKKKIKNEKKLFPEKNHKGTLKDFKRLRKMEMENNLKEMNKGG